MVEAIIAIIAAVVGAVATHYIPLIHSTLTNSRRNSLAGHWLSASYTNPEEGWVLDRIEIEVSQLTIKLENKDMPCGYDYAGNAKVVENSYVQGRWWSKRPGATNSGPFSFYIAPQGNYLIGFYGGSERDGAHRWSLWCLGRDKPSLEEAMERITSSAKLIGTVDCHDEVSKIDD